MYLWAPAVLSVKDMHVLGFCLDRLYPVPTHGCGQRESHMWLAGLAHERDATSDKCTMINSMAQRHLRDAPSAPIVNSFSEVPKVATPERSSSAQPDSALSVQIGESLAMFVAPPYSISE